MADTICTIIPTYNNEGTILNVIGEVCAYCRNIIVVNDGCTDNTLSLLSQVDNIHIVDNGRNRGKGYALKAGFRRAMELGYDYAITIDADGQHSASDIPLFLEAHRKNKDALIIGSRNLKNENMPSRNTFANKFSNFWFAIQTLQFLPDTQTGYRLYPLKSIGGLRCLTSRYEAELELLVFAAWHNMKLVPIKVNVHYPPAEERVSHFHPVYDFARISILNTVLCFLAVVYGYPGMLLRKIFNQR